MEPDMNDSDQYPEDPLQMPPPYWDDSGALDQFIRSIEMVEHLLPGLADEGNRLAPLVDEYHARKEETGFIYDSDYREFAELTDDFMRLELAIASYSDLSTLMGAITVETLINKFCVYNFHRDVAEALEKLSPAEKLIISSALIGRPGVKSRTPYEATKELSRWRNAFAHGHCVDRPTGSIRKNHLRKENSGVPNAQKSVNNLLATVNRYICVHDYLCEVTKNPYVIDIDDNENTSKIRQLADEIGRFSFQGIEEYFPYEIEKTK
jgi:hypothetical protein